jgi:hypothetical protein
LDDSASTASVRQELERPVSGCFPNRLLPADARAAELLKKRTLTNLYNESPAWLVNAHRDLDEAVAAAYGWPVDLPDEEVLSRLLVLNQERASRDTDGGVQLQKADIQEGISN